MRKKKPVKGYIYCKRLEKKFDISVDAVSFKGDWLCKCGRWIRSDPFNHRGIYEGVTIP